MSKNWRSPQQLQAVLEQARRRGLVAEGPAPVPVPLVERRTATELLNRPEPVKPRQGKPVKRRPMNKTEQRFVHQVVMPMIERHEIYSWEFEGMTLRWPDGLRYTPDVVLSFPVTEVQSITHPVCRLTLCEIKGAWAWRQDVVKFRAARDKWGDRFEFQWWQEVDGIWTQTR